MSPPIRKPWACEGSRGNSGMARKEEGGPGGVENFAKGARWQQPLTKSPSRQQGCAPAARRRGGRSDGKVCLPSRRVSPVLTSESHDQAGKPLRSLSWLCFWNWFWTRLCATCWGHPSVPHRAVPQRASRLGKRHSVRWGAAEALWQGQGPDPVPCMPSG